MRSFRLALRVAPIVLVLLCAPFHLMRIRIARLASLFGPAVEVMEPLTNPPNWITEGGGGSGFVEVADALLRAR